MSYRIKTHGPLAAEIQRVADKGIAAALAELQSLDRDDVAGAVYEARKHFKKLRSLVQLLREPLGAKRVKAEEVCYRDMGRKLQGLRDAQALSATLEALARRFFESRRPPVVLAARHVLASEERRARRVLERLGGFDAVRTSLREARARAAAWNLGDFRWKHLAAALRRSYRRAREAWRHASAEPKPRRLHHWRRHTKDLLHHVSLAHRAAPDYMEELAGELEVLSEFLGDDHDLFVLHEVLSRHPRLLPASRAREALFDIIALRREELLGTAFDLAGRIFAEPPGPFLRALEERRDDRRRHRKKARRVAGRRAAVT